MTACADSPWLHRAALAVVVVGYVALAAAYAVRTPIWQVPDEPAHWNYVEHVLLTRTAPRIEAGDYPHDRLEALKAQRFSRGADVKGIEYEDHQPPLYYLLAAGALWAKDYDDFTTTAARLADAPRWFYLVRALGAHQARFVGVFLGALTLAVAWRIARLVSRERAVAVGTVAFVAFLPMNLTVTAAVNNDSLATLLAATLLWLALMRADRRMGALRYALLGGLVVGAALLTKATLYALLSLIVVGGWLAERERRADGAVADKAPDVPAGTRSGAELPPTSESGRAARLMRAVAPILVGTLIAAPWYLRNMATYGITDPLALAAHDAVVVGQPRTAEWIADYGLTETARRFVVTTFESFWGVFGWMGVFLAPWAYGLLAVATVVALVGLGLGLARRRRDRRTSSATTTGGAPAGSYAALLGLAVACAGGGLLLYNLAFVQHQGRYLFPALVPIALAFSLGYFEFGTWVGSRGPWSRLGRCGGVAAVYGGSACLALMAYLALYRYVVPGLSP